MAKRKNNTSLAQSGGINHTFGGGKGGTAQSKPVTAGRKIGGGRTNAGLDYNVRTEGGSKTLVPGKFHVGTPPPLHGGDAASKTVKVKVQKPLRGGSGGTVRGA
jgi:hypothetical protein